MDASLLFRGLKYLAALFIFSIGLGLLAVIATYVADVTQTKHAIRRNYPVVGHFRYLFENLGTLFRQYFFAMDREELPFNCAERSWVHRAAKNVHNTTAFGSTPPCGLPLRCCSSIARSPRSRKTQPLSP